MRYHMFVPEIVYINHKMLTKIFEWSLFLFLSIQAMESITLWVRLICGVIAVPAGVLLLLRTYWEIKVKRREHEIKLKERERKDQEMWEHLEARKKNGVA